MERIHLYKCHDTLLYGVLQSESRQKTTLLSANIASSSVLIESSAVEKPCVIARLLSVP